MKNLKYILSLFLAFGSSASVFAQDVVSTSNPNMHYYMLTAIAIILLILIMVLNGAIKGLTTNKTIIDQLKKKKGAASAILLFFIAQSAFAQGGMVIVEPNYGTVFWAFVTLDLLLLTIVIVQLSVLNGLTKALREEVSEVAEVEAIEAAEAAPTFWTKLTDAVPIEREEEVMTDHEYDGIKELDNKLPPWWVWMFNLTIVFAVVYLADDVFNGTDLPVSIQEYQDEMATADAEIKAYKDKFGSGVDENTAVLVTDAGRLANGKKIYTANCVSCHMADGGGGIGPNFTDQYWIHGGSVKDLFSTVKYGVVTKGMISWKDQLKPEEIEDVISYILTEFPGTTPANPKDPQGELYIPDGGAEEEPQGEEEVNETPAAEEEQS